MAGWREGVYILILSDNVRILIFSMSVSFFYVIFLCMYIVDIVLL